MSSRHEVVLICDLCEAESSTANVVATHRIGVDGVEVEAESCEACWARTLETIAVLGTRGRPIPAKTQRLRGVSKPWPGTTWRFTSHALIRCGERNLDPVEIV